MLPVGSRLEGVGGVYGVAAGAKKLTGESIDLMVGASFGEVESQGALVSHVPLGLSWLSLSGGYLNLSKANLDTQYVRGLQNGPTFRQELSGNMYGLALDASLIPDRLKLTLGYLKSEINLDDYSVHGRKVQRPNKAGYFPVETTSQNLKLSYSNLTDGDFDGIGLKASAGLTTAAGRVGQSDTLTADFRLASYFKILPSLVFVQSNLWSDAHVTSENTKYKTSAQVAAALDTRCATLTDATERADCNELEGYLSEYIAQNNNKGLAVPIGGNQGVRSHDELSLRSAHTRLASFELRGDIGRYFLKDASTKLEVTPFYDLGWSDDRESAVFDRAVQAYGLGLRIVKNNMPIRLAYAQSKSESAWFLALGQSF